MNCRANSAPVPVGILGFAVKVVETLVSCRTCMSVSVVVTVFVVQTTTGETVASLAARKRDVTCGCSDWDVTDPGLYSLWANPFVHTEVVLVRVSY